MKGEPGGAGEIRRRSVPAAAGCRCRNALLAACALLLLAGGLPASAQPAVTIVATDPPANAELPAHAPLYVRIAYSSGSPLRFQASGWSSGGEIRDGAAFNPAPVYPAGEGEAVAWIAYSRPTRIDAVHVSVSDASWQPLQRIERRIGVSWMPVAGAAAREPAEWARRLSDAQQAMTRTALAAHNEGNDMPLVLLFFAAMWSVPGYWALQIYAGLRFRDGWRRAALLPLLITLPLLAYTLLALAAGSNLWPLLMIYLCPFAFAYLAAVTLLRRRSTASRGSA